jgi:hypothetical protein
MTWILLVVTLPTGHEVAHIPFRDAMSCGNAMPALHATLNAEWPGAILQCKDSGVPKVRPRARGDQ